MFLFFWVELVVFVFLSFFSGVYVFGLFWGTSLTVYGGDCSSQGPGSYHTEQRDVKFQLSSPSAALPGDLMSRSLRTVSQVLDRDAVPPRPATSEDRRLPSQPLHPSELRRHHGLSIIPSRNLPPSRSGSNKGGHKGSQNRTGGSSPANRPLVPVPGPAVSPMAVSSLGSSGRVAGSKPWSKPDYFYRSRSSESAVFASTVPGTIFHAGDAPGNRSGVVPVSLAEEIAAAAAAGATQSPAGLQTASVESGTRRLGSERGRFAPALGLASTPGGWLSVCLCVCVCVCFCHPVTLSFCLCVSLCACVCLHGLRFDRSTVVFMLVLFDACFGLPRAACRQVPAPTTRRCLPNPSPAPSVT